MQEACDCGHLHRARALPGSQPELSFVLATALDIANGMACIHSHDIIHRQVCTTCCMLKSADLKGPHHGIIPTGRAYVCRWC